MAESRSGARSTTAGVSSTSREMAKLRASRAARIASENVAGKRRFAIFGVLLTLLVAFVVAAIFSNFSWSLTLVPALAMAVTLAEGRFAYYRSQSRARVETELLKQLRDSRQVEQARRDRVRTAVESRIGMSASVSTVEVAPVTQASADEAEEPIVAQVEPAEWTPRELPAPAYLRLQKAPRRRVVVDADIAGTASVGASASAVSGTNAQNVAGAQGSAPRGAAPVRPVVAKPRPVDAMTSQEAAASVTPAAFDLEDVLDLRRAQ